MFEAAELGRRIGKREYRSREPELHTALLGAQRKLRDADTRVIVIVSGVEGAGKRAVVNGLHRWLDARGCKAARSGTAPTRSSTAPMVESAGRRHRDLTTGTTLLATMISRNDWWNMAPSC